MRKFAAITALLAVATTASLLHSLESTVKPLWVTRRGSEAAFQGGFVNGQEFDLLIRMDVPAGVPQFPRNGGGSLAFQFQPDAIFDFKYSTITGNSITIAQAVANAPVGQIVNLGGYAFPGTTIDGEI
jgi:hypothetical protein